MADTATNKRSTAWYDYVITQGFKWTPTNRYAHSGIDLGVPWGHTVTAPIDGVVSFAGCKAWGGQVDITGYWQGSTYTATVLHLHEILAQVGQHVARGDVLGYSGGDGRGPCATARRYSDGPHVHLELTYGSLGPYHGGPPYTISATSYTVSPALLLADLRGNAQEQLPPDSPSHTVEPFAPLDSLFGLPAATVATLDALPGVDGLIYRLHEAETFAGWKTVDTVAPAPTFDPIRVGPFDLAPAADAVAALNPARVGYWLTGNLLGNATASTVRIVYAIIGLLLLTALAIAAADAMLEQELDTVGDVGKAVGAVAAVAG